MNITLCDLAHILEEANLLVSQTGDAPIASCACDSRHIEDDCLFICKGAAFKSSYLVDALESGATCYMCQEHHAPELLAATGDAPHLVVSDIRAAMNISARLAYGKPDEALTLVGITGTKGKSTTTYMVNAILEAQGKTPSLIGSIKTFDGIESFESHNTTPESPDLMRHLSHARQTQSTPCIMEVSSQGLKYGRVDGLIFEVGCFLNIGRDHISDQEHQDFEDYFTSKLKLFPTTKHAVINLDCDHADRIVDATRMCKSLTTISVQTRADVWASDIQTGQGHLSFVAHTPYWEEHISLALCGLFNVENALAAIAITQLLGCSKESILQGLSSCKVPGRMELYHLHDRISAVVDFAHNKLSFEKLFESLVQEFPGRKLIAVFGAPGNKAQERRCDLTRVAEHYASHIIFCEEDPIHEDPYSICAEQASFITTDVAHEIVVDRTQACIRALELATSDESSAYLICVLGKGDDRWMHVQDNFLDVMPDACRLKEAARSVLGDK